MIMGEQIKPVEISVATGDINRWLDYKKVSDTKRESKKAAVEALVSEVTDGYLSVMEDFKLQYKLKFPIEDSEGNIYLEKLDFVPRLQAKDLFPYMKGVKAGDLDGSLRANICALTKQSMGVISKLDTEDMAVAESIAVFFL